MIRASADRLGTPRRSSYSGVLSLSLRVTQDDSRSAKLNAFEHGLKLGKERGFIGSILVDTRPGEQRPPADVDDSDSGRALGLGPVTILGSVRYALGLGAPWCAVEVLCGGDGHQGRAVAVDGNLLLVRERRPVAGEPAKISQVVLGRRLRRGLSRPVQRDRQQESDSVECAFVFGGPCDPGQEGAGV